MGVEFRILGPLEVRLGGQTVPLGGTKQRLLLALLLMRADEVIPTNRLIDELWHERPPRTATASLQMHVSGLRRRLGNESARLVTQPQGYVIRVGDALDLRRFERLLEAAAHAADPADAAAHVRAAEGLWRGPALADLSDEPSLQPAIARLEELRLVATERRVAAELALGQHSSLVPELDALVANHPFREELHRQRMLALYRCGRQADALAAFRTTREMLADELGIEPSPQLRELERAILAQAPELDLSRAASGVELQGTQRQRTLLAALDGGGTEPALLAFAVRLARAVESELLLVRSVPDAEGLSQATSELKNVRTALQSEDLSVRVAAFVSVEPPAEFGRFASRLDVELLLSANEALVFAPAPCDVAVLVPREGRPVDGAVLVPFGAGEHDWAAVELGARLALAEGATLRLAGTAAAANSGRRDASLSLADASLAVQYAFGVTSEPILLGPETHSLLEAAQSASVIVAGVSDRWRREGIGAFRLTLARDAPVPTLFIRRGLRPGGLAPRAAETRYTWSLQTVPHPRGSEDGGDDFVNPLIAP